MIIDGGYESVIPNPSEKYDLDNIAPDDIEAYIKLKKKNLIYELSFFDIDTLKSYLRKSKIKKLNKKIRTIFNLKK